MWGVRRRDAARHNESGWLIRPEMRSSLPSTPGLFIYFCFRPISSLRHLPSLWFVQARKKILASSRPADPAGPVRERL